jgi:hypothetical protein
MESYQAVWNEQDPERRRKLVAELWAPDGAYVTGANEHKGLEAIEASVARAYEDFVGKGYAFRLASEVAAHHAGVRFTWDMVPVGGGEAAAIGDEFLILDDAGQIKLDYQFMVKMPPA